MSKGDASIGACGAAVRLAAGCIEGGPSRAPEPIGVLAESELAVMCFNHSEDMHPFERPQEVDGLLAGVSDVGEEAA